MSRAPTPKPITLAALSRIARAETKSNGGKTPKDSFTARADAAFQRSTAAEASGKKN